MSDILNMSISRLDESILIQEKATQKISTRIKKLSPVETYIALLKGYCVMTVIMIPKGF